MNKRKIGGLGSEPRPPATDEGSREQASFSHHSLSFVKVFVSKSDNFCQFVTFFVMPSAKRQRMSSVVWSLGAVNASGVGLITVSTRQWYRPNVDNIEKKRSCGYLDFSLPRMIFV